MKKVIESNIPIKMWLNDIEDGALEQAINISKLPFAFKHIAIMPDSHQGYGMPIGGVLATKDVIVPNAVGVDIGCGMCAVRTSLNNIDIKTLKKIIREIRKVVPVGFNKHKESQLMDWEEQFEGNIPKICMENWENASKSIGTLGGGNHFIEIQKGDDGYIWIMIHSGSRNLGLQVAEYYNKLALRLNKKWYSNNINKDLAFLPIDSEEGRNYLEEMNYCIDYALANRKLMIDRIKDCFMKETFCIFEPMINIAHNYCRLENHFGENVYIHRKGATSARKGEIGIIPGSQGTSSYIVEGLGNKESFESCSHGAGRKMSRTKAQNELNLEEEKDKLNNQRIIHSIRDIKDLDEASGAYKDIDEVMKNQKDLVKIKVKLTPLAVVKG